MRASALLTLCCAGVCAAQTETLYVTDGDNDFVKAIQGGSVVDENLATGGSRRYRIAVRDTIWLGDMDQMPNAEFTLALDPTGDTSPAGLDITEGTDGTTDGVWNYTVESFVSDAVVTRYNLDWSGGDNVFDVSGTQIVGITYDSANGTLWISDQLFIGEYDMDGNLLSSFAHAGDRGSLAYEASTDTLWYVTNSGGSTIRQYAKDGTLLQTLNVPFGGNVWGAEFRLAEAGCFADCDGNGELNILDFVCYQGLFQSGDAGADCDGNGELNILDFVCFQAEFVAGCP
jgi:hypothetical protein